MVGSKRGGHSKVHDSYEVALALELGDEDISGLDVPVNDAAAMRLDQRGEHL